MLQEHKSLGNSFLFQTEVSKLAPRSNPRFYKHYHAFCYWLPLPYNSRVECFRQKPCGVQNLKYFISGPFHGVCRSQCSRSLQGSYQSKHLLHRTHEVKSVDLSFQKKNLIFCFTEKKFK